MTPVPGVGGRLFASELEVDVTDRREMSRVGRMRQMTPVRMTSSSESGIPASASVASRADSVPKGLP
jgi:hypothetical protein